MIPIDHAASLSFHHGWRVTEQTPSEKLEVPPDHVFADRRAALEQWHPGLRQQLDRESIRVACESLPGEWLGPPAFESDQRQRSAYSAMLWKRLSAMDRLLAR